MFAGAMTALITPFRDGRLDVERLKEQVRRQISSGISGVVPVGTTGESPTVSLEEHVRVIEATVQEAGHRIKVIAGTGANATAEAIELHRRAKEVGADACLSVNPYYNKPNQEGLYRHFMALTEAVDLPIVLYNIPGRTGITMTAATVARLNKSGNFPAIKEATGSLDLASEIRSMCDITIISGDDALTLPLMSIGATGVISVLSNLFPAEVADMVGLFRRNEVQAATKLHHKFYPLTRALFVDGNPVGIKCAMALAGMDAGELRLPLVAAGEDTRQLIGAHMQALGMLR